MKFKMGVFQIRNTLNNKIFIGSSTNLDAIWNRHRVQLNAGMHPNTALQQDWKQLGAEIFAYEILSEIEQKDTDTKDYNEEVKELEALYVDDLQPFDDKGYNKRAKSNRMN